MTDQHANRRSVGPNEMRRTQAERSGRLGDQRTNETANRHECRTLVGALAEKLLRLFAQSETAINVANHVRQITNGVDHIVCARVDQMLVCAVHSPFQLDLVHLFQLSFRQTDVRRTTCNSYGPTSSQNGFVNAIDRIVDLSKRGNQCKKKLFRSIIIIDLHDRLNGLNGQTCCTSPEHEGRRFGCRHIAQTDGDVGNESWNDRK